MNRPPLLPVPESNKPEQDPQQTGSGIRVPPPLAPRRFAVTFLIMALFWTLFSGRFDPFHICLGVASCLIVAALNHQLLLTAAIRPGLILHWLRFAGYIPWLLYQILLANLHVLYLVFHPKMVDLIDPHIIQFNSRLKKEVPRTTFANSITLTPGTITVHVSVMGKFSVHCINEKSGRSLPGAMEKRIGRVFEP
ncbi:MAG: Na+/H+ antiporter subunit E [Desulfobacteraceae bacterium]|jgi:multicomponent Na+:H+ antiporter subunit E